MALAFGGLNAVLRDYARFGLLYLQEGMWNGVQVIPKEWISASITPDASHLQPGPNDLSNTDFGYGYQWYVQSVFEDDEGKVEAQSYGTKGYHLNNIWIFPELELLVVRNSLYRRVLEVTDDTVRTGDLTALLQGENTPVNVHHTLQQGNAINVNGIWYTYNSERGIEFLQESKFMRLILASMDQT